MIDEKGHAPRTTRRPPASVHPRDQERSPFTDILTEVVARYPGAYAAALVDVEGETVDYAGNADPFDIKVTAAHWTPILAGVSERQVLGNARTLVVRGTKRSFVMCALPEGYAVVLLLRRFAGFASSRALSACVHAIAREAGWRPPLRIPTPWFPVLVTCDRPNHPRGVCPFVRTVGSNAPEPVDVLAPPWRPIEVIGTVVGLGPREHGYRVRLDSGIELTLVREPGDYWYADEAVSVSGSA